jgi:DNA-binding CsgD family transcriptional regulator
VLPGDALPGIAQLPLHFLEGRWDEVRHCAAAEQTFQLSFVYAATICGRYARASGDAERAWKYVRDWLPAGVDSSPGEIFFRPAVDLQLLAAQLAIDAGDLAAARAWLSAHDRWLTWSGAVLGQAERHLGWAAYHRAAGEPDLARDHAGRALARASEPRQPLALLAAHRALGELATFAGDHAEAATHIDAALTLADACGAPYERALTLLALAELRVAERKPALAGKPLDEARAILTPLEAVPALARADALATRLAAPAPATRADSALFGLTGRELEVLRLVAEGLTDAQVAARLFVSRNTVNAHLRGIYGKLGVTSRAAATRLAIEHRLA